MSCAELTVQVHAGSDFLWPSMTVLDLDGNAVDLTGATLRMTVRETPAGAIIAQFNSDDHGDVVSVTDAAAGTIAAALPGDRTRSWTWLAGVYKLEADVTDRKLVATGTIHLRPASGA